MLSITVITLFPEIFPGPLGASLVGKALEKGIWRLEVIPLRHYGNGPHQEVDDMCYGGGPGMVIRPDVVHSAFEDAVKGIHDGEKPTLIYMTPRGKLITQQALATWSQKKNLVVLCGRYEGVDQRVLDAWQVQEVSLGDFVLCGGEIPAMALIEGCVRLLPDVVGNHDSLINESFQEPLLEHPLYTRPLVWQGQSVPPVLTSGHHQHIARWRYQKSCEDTQERRPDLWLQKNSAP